MDRWLTYIKERFPILTFVALVSGISLSGIYLYGKEFALLPFIMSAIGIFLFFALLRLMDEVKDIDKDKIAHPDRPLPRGLIKKAEAIQVINVVQVILFAFSLVVWVLLQRTAGIAYACVALYLWLMYKEFGIGEWLGRRPLLYGISHQLIVFPVAVFAVAVAHPEAIWESSTWSFGLMLLGAFFCYEVCRKLDPQAHPILATYIHYYGFRRAFEIAVVCLALSAMGAIALYLEAFLIPCEIFVFVTLILLFFQPAWYRLPEVAASLSLMAHVWAVVIYRFVYG